MTEQNQDNAEQTVDTVVPAEKSSEEKVETAPLAVVQELRETGRQDRATIENLRLQNIALQNQASQPAAQVQPATAEESPLDAHIRENPGYAPTGETLLAQKQWDAKEAEKTRHATARTTEDAAVRKAQTDAVTKFGVGQMGQGLDFQALANQTAHLLTDGDRLDISQATDRAQKCYEIMLAKAKADTTLGPEIIRLQDAAKPKTKETKEKDAEEGSTDDEQVEGKVKTQAEIVSTVAPHIARLM